MFVNVKFQKYINFYILCQMKQKNGDNLYKQFRSNDPLIDYLMSEVGQLSLDRQIIKMMKDMDTEEIIDFSNQFFKLGQNQCQSLQKIIGNQLTSRVNLQGGSDSSSKNNQLKISENQQKSLKQAKCSSRTLQIAKMKEQIAQSDQMDSIWNQKAQNQEQLQQKQPKIVFQQFKYEDYCPKASEDYNYLTQANNVQRDLICQDGHPNQDHQNAQNEPQTNIQSDFHTTIQQNQESQFEQIQRIQLPQGKFRIKYNNGDMYEGELQKQMKNGWGEYYYSTGEKYDGFFQDDQIQGYGRYFFLSGTEYQGDWSSGMKNGMGILKFSNHDVYEGSFFNDLFNGKGIYKYACGDIFKGNWKDGLRNGKGTFQGIDGSLKIGHWVDDKFQI